MEDEGGGKLNVGVAEQGDAIQVQPNVERQPSSWLTAEEAAEHLRVRTRNLLQWARQGKGAGKYMSHRDLMFSTPLTFIHESLYLVPRAIAGNRESPVCRLR